MAKSRKIKNCKIPLGRILRHVRQVALLLEGHQQRSSLISIGMMASLLATAGRRSEKRILAAHDHLALQRRTQSLQKGRETQPIRLKKYPPHYPQGGINKNDS